MPLATVTTPAGTVRVHLAAPTSPGPSPAVIVIHEVFGLNDDIRGHADHFAARGYLAAAPDLFSYGPKLRCVRETLRSIVRGTGPAWEILDAVRSWVADREDCTGRVGIIGYCTGGRFALLAAPRPGFDVASVNYGQVPRDAEEVLRGACPIVGSYGAEDRALRGHAARLEGALVALGVEHDVKEYAEAGHSFLNRHSGPLLVLDKVLGAGLREPQAGDAQQRIDAFFDRHLRDGASTV